MKKRKRYVISFLIIILFGGMILFLCKRLDYKIKPSINDNKAEVQEDIPKTETSTSSETINKNDENKTNKVTKPNQPSTDHSAPSTEEQKSEESTSLPTKPIEKPSNSDKTAETSSTQTEKEEQPDTSDKPITNEKEESIEKTKEQENDAKREKIQSTYGVKIQYGNEIGNYQPRGINPTRLTDENDIDTYLNRIDIELAKYPKGFFEEFNKKGMPLTIYLIKSANGAFSGFTDYQFMNDIKLTIATDYDFEYTLHHEIMHYIDCYLNIIMYPNTPYEEYEMLNPINFTYGSALEEQIYHMANNRKGAYFITKYGSMSVQEDRAEVFKYMMARAYRPLGCFDKDEIIRKKAELISKQIKDNFKTITGTYHWDRFIT